MQMTDDDWDELNSAFDAHYEAADWIERCEKLRDEAYHWRSVANNRDADDQTEVELLREQLQAKREECGRLQTENETLRAAAQTHEPVGWFYNLNAPATVTMDVNDYYSSRLIADNMTRRRIYAGPAEQIPEQPNV